MIELRNVTVRADMFWLRNISFKITTSQYAVLMGRTGQGKTTLLETICGLRSVASGSIWIDEVDVTHWSPSDRGIGYVPQDLALFSTMTVREHLAFALKLRRQSRVQIQNRVGELANDLGITHLLERRIKNLSGGESQRVALGRSLSFRPSILLLDEPLSALDQATRIEMHALLRKVQKLTQVTTLHVTHNPEDAASLAETRLVIDEGAMVL